MATARCLVTGGAGFIGSHVVDCLLADGCDVLVLDNLSVGKRENLPKEAELVVGDICDAELVTRLAQGRDYVFHLAALPRIQPSFEDPEFHDRVNVLGSLRVFEAARAAKVKKLVFSASSACYGTPDVLPTPETARISCLSPYALQKYTAEQYLLILGERFEVPVVTLRYFNVYGPRSFNEADRFNAYSSVIGIFDRQRKEGKPLTITGDGEQRRDFVHVRDVARANWLAAKSDCVGEAFNIGAGAAFSINEIAAKMGGPSVHIPERKGEALATHADISKAQRLLGWSPLIALQEGLADV